VLARHAPSRVSEGFTVSDEAPEAFLRQRAAEGALSVLVEGGPTLIGAFLREGLVDELLLVMAPRLFGDPRAPGWARVEPPFGLDDAPRFHLADLERLGDELLVAWRSEESCAFVEGLVGELSHFG
jgi:diaminohydroxyphosphoribosylaminopyrimidine deaminase/5-amino-6-(5-phosphoribosylamino)uracil reductase